MDTLASYEELELPPPRTGLQGHAGGKDKSWEGPGLSLASGFFKVNKKLLFILKALVCVGGVWMGGEPCTFPPQSTGQCVAHSPHKNVQGRNRGLMGPVPPLLQWMQFLKDLSSVSCAHVQWTRPASTCRRADHRYPHLPIQHRAHLRTWPSVEIDWDLIVSNLYVIHEMALAEQPHAAANLSQ